MGCRPTRVSTPAWLPCLSAVQESGNSLFPLVTYRAKSGLLHQNITSYDLREAVNERQ